VELIEECIVSFVIENRVYRSENLAV